MSETLRVYDIAHCRAGDKGNTSNVSVIAYEETDWAFLRDTLTEARVMAAYAHIATGPVRRYELPKLKAFNFVIEAGPATTGVELALVIEQRMPAAHAFVDAGLEEVRVLAGEGPFRAGLPGHPVLLIGQLGTPFGVALA